MYNWNLMKRRETEQTFKNNKAIMPENLSNLA